MSWLASARRAWREEPVTLAFFAVACVIGVSLRLTFPGIIEYKGDEHWTFHSTLQILRTGQWPATGMDSSVGIANPGLSLWFFAILSRITGSETPVTLARAVAGMNGLALVAIMLFAWGRPREERRLWLWTGALAGVDPLGIILQRKIWAQSVLPLFMWLVFMGWRARSTIVGAFLWGFVGALVGQIHMSGFLYVPVFVLWAIFAHLRRTNRIPTQWVAWVAGSVLGALLLIPWLGYLRSGGAHWSASSNGPRGIFWKVWMEDALGWNLDYSLGMNNLNTLKRFPMLNHQMSGLVDVALDLSLAIGALAIGLLVWEIVRRPKGVWERLGSEDAVAFLIAFVGYGLVMTALQVTLYRHYFLIAYPFEAMTVPLLGWLAGRRLGWVGLLWAAHLLIAVCVLQFLLLHHGAPGGDFGTAFEFQGRAS